MPYLYDFTLNLMDFSKFGGNFHTFNLVTVNTKGKISCCCSKLNGRPSNVLSNQKAMGLVVDFESPTLVHSLNLHLLLKGKKITCGFNSVLFENY